MSVSIGDPNPGIQLSALAEILSSSAGVQARIDHFEKAKKEAEAAFEMLRIGTDAKAAYDDATAKHNEVVALQERLNAAHDHVIELAASADAKAKEIVADAEAQRGLLIAELAEQRASHNEWRDARVEEIKATQEKLQVELAAVTDERAKLAAATQRAELAEAAATVREAEAAAAIASATAAEQRAREIATRLVSSLDATPAQVDG